MPYRHAYLYVAIVLVVTIIGFWPSYFSIIDGARFEFHAHAVTATAWIILVGFQSWSIHRRLTGLHREIGKFSLFLFPLLIASFVMIINVSASRFLNGDSQFWQQFGPIIGYIMVTAISAYLVLFVQALRCRHNVYLHSGYMLATPFILWESGFGRVINQFVPSLQGVLDGIVISDIMAAALALFLFLRFRKHGIPFLVAAFFLIAQIVGIYTFVDAQWLRDIFTAYAQVPQELTVSIGFILGLFAVWLGWAQPSDPKRAVLASQ